MRGRRTLLTVVAAMLALPLGATAAHAAPTPSPSVTATPKATATATPKAAARATPTPTATPTATPTPAPTVTGDALVVAFASTPVLTLPATDGFDDATRIRIWSPQKGTVDLDAIGKGTVPLAQDVALKHTRGGWQRTVTVPVQLLKKGAWTIRASRSDAPAVRARTTVPLRVGSGRPVKVVLTPDAGTVYPLKDGAFDATTATVVATDETGTVLPVTGTLSLKVGTTVRKRTLAADAATIPVTRLPLGIATLTAVVKAPAGKAVERTTSIALSPTGVGPIRLAASSDTVQPVVDGLLDSVVLTTGGAASGGSTEPVTGTLTIAKGTTVLQRWPVTSGDPAQFTWDGRTAGKIVPGVYTASLTLQGPEGLPKVKTVQLTVSGAHLPYRVQDLFTVAAGNQQGLAVHDGIFYVGFDNMDGTSRIERYNASGNPYPLTLSPLSIGHAAELSFSTTTNLLYAANGGVGNPTTVWSLEPLAADGPSALRQTFDLSALGDCGMVAVDDAGSRLLVFSRSAAGPYTLSSVALVDTTAADGTVTTAGTVLSTVPITIDGTPQGMEVVGTDLWVYTSFKKKNHIATYALNNGLVADGAGSDLMNAGEGEGLATATDASGVNWMYVGTHSTNRVGVLQPVADEPLG